jgi:CRISPR-associated protein Csx17
MSEQLSIDFSAPPPPVVARPAEPPAQVPARLHVHLLTNCRPRPLGSWLKALGILRIVAEQADPGARGYWQNDAFVLVTRLDEAALFAFFLNDWRPNPFMSPWNKGSGLLSPDARGVGPLESSVAKRFEDVREGITQSRALTEAMADAVLAEKALKDRKTRIKDAAGKAALANDPDYQAALRRAAKVCKQLKDELQPNCQRHWRGPALRWLRAALVITADGGAKFPALLGTGGNDGKLDFTNHAMQRLGDLFDLASPDGAPKPGAEKALRAALFTEAERALLKAPIGQYAPGSSGGPNTSVGPLGDSLLNPWDLPLLLEGALLCVAGTSRRLGGAASEQTVAPFAVRAGAAGYASAALSDEGARGEQWLPLWARPWTAVEVAALLQEGRCQLGARPSETALDAARAVVRLGVARGVTAFERYGFLERNGKTNYAVPLGRFTVRAEPLAPLLDDLDAGGWWARVRRAVRDEHAPASLIALERRLADDVMGVLAHGHEPARFQSVLVALAELEARFVESGAFTAAKRLQVVPRLSPGWVRAADDGGPELRLALALAGAGAGHDRSGRPVDGLRHHWLPLDGFGRFAQREKALAHDPRVVAAGRDAEADLIRILQRRLTEAAAGAGRTLRVQARPGVAASPRDIMALLTGAVDLNRTLWLARALSALDWSTFQPARHGPARESAVDTVPIDPAWAALRLCHLPAPLADGRRVPVDPAVLRLLATGDAARAFSVVLGRLRAVGLHPPLIAVGLDASVARRMAASLAFPLSPRAVASLVRDLDPRTAPSAQEAHHVR